VAAFRTARAVAGAGRRRQIERLFDEVDLEVWTEMMAADSRLVATLTRWYLTNVPEGLAEAELERTARRFAQLEIEAREWGSLQRRAERSARMDRLRSAGVPADLVVRTSVAADLVHAPDILEVAEATGRPMSDVGVVFHRIGRVMGLDALEQVVSKVKLSDTWQRWALQTIEDDLRAVRRSLAERILIGTGAESVEEALDEFLAERSTEAGRVAELVGSLQSQPINDAAPLMVAVRQLQTLAAT
jgi:glutamate dehydrogenase